MALGRIQARAKTAVSEQLVETRSCHSRARSTSTSTSTPRPMRAFLSLALLALAAPALVRAECDEMMCVPPLAPLVVSRVPRIVVAIPGAPLVRH